MEGGIGKDSLMKKIGEKMTYIDGGRSRRLTPQWVCHVLRERNKTDSPKKF